LFLILNDGAYGSKIHKLRVDGVNDSGAIFGRTDFAAIAKGFGLRGATITDVEDCQPLFEAYRKQNTAEVWNIHISDKVMNPSTRRRLAEATARCKRDRVHANRSFVELRRCDRYTGRARPPAALGRSQVVRHRILIPAFPGSNPGAPANQCGLSSLTRKFAAFSVSFTLWNSRTRTKISRLARKSRVFLGNSVFAESKSGDRFDHQLNGGG
jgi:hypothetical protein